MGYSAVGESIDIEAKREWLDTFTGRNVTSIDPVELIDLFVLAARALDELERARGDCSQADANRAAAMEQALYWESIYHNLAAAIAAESAPIGYHPLYPERRAAE
jgi:hypothetical protein